MFDNFADIPPSVWVDFLKLFCGEPLGNGIGRQVYVLETDPSKVIKIEYAECSFQNVEEWQTWGYVAGTEWEKWFAPCRFISESGNVLVQDRTDPLPQKFKPPRIPQFLTDWKRENYGLIGKQLVCHDYGTNVMRSVGLTKRTRQMVLA